MSAVLHFFRLTKRLGPKGTLAVKAGLMVYDRLGNRHRTVPRHSVHSRDAARKLVLQLSPKTRLVTQYHDALMNQPERLVMELIRDGEPRDPGRQRFLIRQPVNEALGKAIDAHLRHHRAGCSIDQASMQWPRR